MGQTATYHQPMPVLHFVKKFVEVPSTWDGWAMRIMTIGVILVLGSSWILFLQANALRDQILQGRSDRVAFQVDQTKRMCALLRLHEHDPVALKAVGC